jgi:cytochrome P450
MRYMVWKIKNSCKILYKERMKFLQSSADEESSQEPQDYFQMMLRHVQTNYPHELNYHDMINYLALANLGSFYQTIFTVTNIILNIVASDKEYHTISILRDEVSKVMGKEPNWTKAALAKLVRTDSILRETLRINSFGNRSIIRKVMVDNLRTEDGILLPKGAMVSILAHPAQCDDDIYADPLKFDPFRFSRLREANESTIKIQKDDPNIKTNNNNTASNLSFVSTGPQNLSFGHGRHACPGRFIVDFELKMIVAYLITHYEIEFPREYEGRRPEMRWDFEAMIPPAWARIRVRRRVV